MPIFKDFYVGRTKAHSGLFEQLRGKEKAPNQVPDGNINMINETSTNNGITKKASSNFVFEAPAITVSVNYASTVFLQVEKFCASVNIIILKSEWLNKYPEAGLYIVTCLKKNNAKYDYAYKISKDRLNETLLSIPIKVDENDNPVLDPNCTYHKDGYIPDFEYMRDRIAELERDRIAELERDRIAELEGYLTVTGLNDYELTDEDIVVLSLLETRDNEVRHNADNVTVFKEFKVNSNNGIGLFKCSKGTRLTKQNRVDGDIPLLTAGIGIGQGVASYIAPTDKMTLYGNDITIDMFGSVFYHDYEHYGDDNIHFLVNDNMSHLQKIFITCMLDKCLRGQYSYGMQFRMKHLDVLSVILPIQTDENNNPIIDTTYKYHKDGYIPDWSFMERYIKAMEKVVIADVVKYKDEVIAQTKALVNT